MKTFAGSRRRSSAATLAGRVFVPTSSNGLPLRPATGPAARPSGYELPTATYTFVTLLAACVATLMATAVA
jgi:hypothetical protein